MSDSFETWFNEPTLSGTRGDRFINLMHKISENPDCKYLISSTVHWLRMAYEAGQESPIEEDYDE